MKALWNSEAHHEEILGETVCDPANREYYHKILKGNEEEITRERSVLGKKEIIPC